MLERPRLEDLRVALGESLAQDVQVDDLAVGRELAVLRDDRHLSPDIREPGRRVGRGVAVAPEQDAATELAHLPAARVALARDPRAGHRLLERDHPRGVAHDRRHVGMRPGRVQHDVEAAQLVHGRGVVEPDVDREVQELVPDPVEVPAHLLLARDHADVLHRAPELALALEERDEVSALGGDPRRLHPRRSAADDGDLDRLRRPAHLGVRGVPARRVDRAGDLLLGHQRFLPAAAQARDAAADLLDSPELGLDRPVRIGEELPGQAHQVGLALGEDLLAVLGVAQRVARDDRDPDGTLDRLGGVGRPALRILHRVEAGAGALLHAHREIDGGAAGALEHPGDLDAFLRRRGRPRTTRRTSSGPGPGSCGRTSSGSNRSTASGKRIRFSKLPPNRSVRMLRNGLMNSDRR